MGESMYTLSLATGVLDWSECVFNASSPWKLSSGMRVLSAQELQAALDGLHMVTVWNGSRSCGADKPTYTIEVTTTSGSRRYTDSFYECNMAPDTIYVDNIDAAFNAVTSQAHP